MFLFCLFIAENPNWTVVLGGKNRWTNNKCSSINAFFICKKSKGAILMCCLGCLPLLRVNKVKKFISSSIRIEYWCDISQKAHAMGVRSTIANASIASFLVHFRFLKIASIRCADILNRTTSYLHLSRTLIIIPFWVWFFEKQYMHIFFFSRTGFLASLGTDLTA